MPPATSDQLELSIQQIFSEALAFHNSGQLNRAKAGYEQILTIQPNHFAALNLLSAIAMQTNQPQLAVDLISKAIEVNPDVASPYYNRGVMLQKLKQHDDAIASYDKAIALNPNYAAAYANRGVALKELKLTEAAVTCYNKAISLDPDFADAHFNKSMVLLSEGDFERGWELYEWRWKCASYTTPRRDFFQPRWNGAESISGKTILLHREQGLGDTIQFCRYARLVADLGANVILEVEQPLVSLLSSSFGAQHQVVAKGSILPPFDIHCPLLSLPLAFKTTIATIPSRQAYLRIDSSKVSKWASKLCGSTKPRIGIVWSGRPAHTNDHNRSIKLFSLIPFIPYAFEYFSLQKEVREDDRATLHAYPNIRHFGDELEDFSDTAALCEQMDIVISVDTSVAHLSAAIGKATWVLLPSSPDWRWLLDREDSPWYPSARLFRQRNAGNWVDVFEEVNAALIALAKVP
jgi:Tfp pilus assembly protein PilF